MEYGLIGKALGHSYSKPIHEELCGYEYNLCPLPTMEDFKSFMQAKEFKAINVTIPYKKDVIAYCAQISPQAKAIGAVNTIVNVNGQLHGYNTDYAGFCAMAKRAKISFENKHVMILGTGGTQLTAFAVVKDANAKSICIVSRNPLPENENSFNYETALTKSETQIIINTTPVGMYPNNGVCPIDLTGFKNLEGVIDVIYNPHETQLLQNAKKLGLKTANGLYMLVAQAKYAAEIFTATELPESEIERITQKMYADVANIVLIGMPGCGKSHVGKLLSEELGRKLVDLDSEIEKTAGCTIASLFKTKGEAFFRSLESEMCAKYGKETGLVIATGGGAILRSENVCALKQNGVMLYLNRPLKSLQVGNGRPLSTDANAVAKLYEQRAPIYTAVADAIVESNSTPQGAQGLAKEAFYAFVNSERA